MDRAAEFPLQSSEIWPAGHSCKRNSQGKLFGCLLAFCLLAVIVLALPVLYLLASHLREPQACHAEERAVRMPEFQKQTGAPDATELKPRAHLEVWNSNQLTFSPKPYSTLQWKSQSNSKANMKYENGSLVIPKTGYYFVYAQVTFQSISAGTNNCSGKTPAVTPVTQIIWKFSGGYPKPIDLLKSTSFISENSNWKHAIYLGAVLKLQEDDRLFVNVSSAERVFRTGSATFFGAFLI